MLPVYKGNDADSDDEILPDFYFPRKENTRVNAVKRLQLERENEFVNDMLGSLQSVMEDAAKVQVPAEHPKKFDPLKLTNTCISSWRDERLAILSSIEQHTKKNPTAKRMSRNKRDKKYRLEPAAVELNSFLQTLQQQIGEAAMELENLSRKKFVLKEEDIMSRPSQLTTLVEVVAGTEKDELRDSRKRALGKLSKTCAYWVTHRNTAQEGRPVVQREVQQIRGYFTDEESFDNNSDRLNMVSK